MCLYKLTEVFNHNQLCHFSLFETNLFCSAWEDLARWNQSFLSHSLRHKMDIPADKTTSPLSIYGLQVHFKIQFPVSVIKSVLFYSFPGTSSHKHTIIGTARSLVFRFPGGSLYFSISSLHAVVAIDISFSVTSGVILKFRLDSSVSRAMTLFNIWVEVVQEMWSRRPGWEFITRPLLSPAPAAASHIPSQTRNWGPSSAYIPAPLQCQISSPEMAHAAYAMSVTRQLASTTWPPSAPSYLFIPFPGFIAHAEQAPGYIFICRSVGVQSCRVSVEACSSSTLNVMFGGLRRCHRSVDVVIVGVISTVG